MKGLTKKQEEVLRFIRQWVQLHAYSPSFREIQEHFKLKSTASVHKHIQALVRKGVLKQEKRSSRSIQLRDHTPQSLLHPGSAIELPLIGKLPFPSCKLQTTPSVQTVSVPKNLVPRPEVSYVLQIVGRADSDEALLEGDLVVVEVRQEAMPGELILGKLTISNVNYWKHSEWFLKRYYPEGQYVRLESSLRGAAQISVPASIIEIQGVVVASIRTYEPA